MAVRVVQFVIYVREHPRQNIRGDTPGGATWSAPGEAAFREANRQITLNKGTVAFGNNAEATALAAEYSKSLKVLREGLFTKGKENALSIAQGEMLTYCHLNPDTCVFLVHVPELRRFTSQAKDSMTELAWMNAQSVLKAKAASPPGKLGVGVRGAALYESVTLGRFVPDPKPGNDGVRERAKGMSGVPTLYPFFASPSETPKPPRTTPAK